MVRQGDFEISLVHADTKEPFKEHAKDGKVYVEVEPDAEYFICMKRVGNAAQGALLAYASVDEKFLGYHMTFPSISAEPYHAGLWACKDGTSTQTAFKFTKPRFVPNDGDQKPRMLMGKVEVKIYKGILDGYKESSNVESTWEASAIDQALAGGLAEKKALRSGEGSTSIVLEKQSSGQVATYKYGEKVDVCTLNYCTAVGLIQVGALPKPPLWVYARMLHPAKKRSTTVAATLDDLSNLKIGDDNDEE